MSKSKSTPSTLASVHLEQSPKTDRYYFTVQSWESQEIVGNDGQSFQSLIPKGNAGQLPEDAIRSVILPIAWNDLTRAEVVAKVGTIADIDYTTGELFLRPTK